MHTHTRTHKALPHAGTRHTQCALRTPSPRQGLYHTRTCTHVDMSPQTWSLKHMHAHVYTHTRHFQAGCCFGLDACCRHTLINSNRRERTIPGRSPTLLCKLPRPLGNCLAVRCRLQMFQLGTLSPERCGGSRDRFRRSLGRAS